MVAANPHKKVKCHVRPSSSSTIGLSSSSVFPDASCTSTSVITVVMTQTHTETRTPSASSTTTTEAETKIATETVEASIVTLTTADTVQVTQIETATVVTTSTSTMTETIVAPRETVIVGAGYTPIRSVSFTTTGPSKKRDSGNADSSFSCSSTVIEMSSVTQTTTVTTTHGASAPILTATETATVTSTTAGHPEPITTTQTIPTTQTITLTEITTQTSTTTTTTTTTVDSNEPAPTLYAPCRDPANYISTIDNNLHIFDTNLDRKSSTYANWSIATAEATAESCCEACHADPKCTGSMFTDDGGKGICSAFGTDGACSPGEAAQLFIVANIRPPYRVTAINGGCGQWGLRSKIIF